MKKDDIILNIVNGRKVGTFFTDTKPAGVAPDLQATRARDGGRHLQGLSPDQVTLLLPVMMLCIDFIHVKVW